MEKIKESVESVLKERMKSPLYGTFILSWLVCNWKIIIVLFFTSTKELGQHKMSYIDKNLLKSIDTIFYPVVGTLALLIIIPWGNELAFRLKLYFEKRKAKAKNSSELNEFFRNDYYKDFGTIVTACNYSMDIQNITANSDLTEDMINYYVAHSAIEFNNDKIHLTESGKIYLKEYYDRYEGKQKRSFFGKSK